MQIFVTGTDTNVGKTIASSWLCHKLGLDYFKPIQSGLHEITDSDFVRSLNIKHKVHQEIYRLNQPLSPHLSAQIDDIKIDIKNIVLPSENIIVEGAGGLYVPLNDKEFIIDLIKFLNISCVLVARTALGTINHTLLSIKALKDYNIPLLGVIMVGKENIDNKIAIEKYGQTKVIATLPIFDSNNNWKQLKEFNLHQSILF